MTDCFCFLLPFSLLRLLFLLAAMTTWCACGCGRRVSLKGMYRPACKKEAQEKGLSIETHDRGRKRVSANTQKLVVNRKAQGTCMRCPIKIPVGFKHKRCPFHHRIHIASARRKRNKLRIQKICFGCRVTESLPNETKCQPCKDEGNEVCSIIRGS